MTPNSTFHMALLTVQFTVAATKPSSNKSFLLNVQACISISINHFFFFWSNLINQLINHITLPLSLCVSHSHTHTHTLIKVEISAKKQGEVNLSLKWRKRRNRRRYRWVKLKMEAKIQPNLHLAPPTPPLVRSAFSSISTVQIFCFASSFTRIWSCLCKPFHLLYNFVKIGFTVNKKERK